MKAELSTDRSTAMATSLAPEDVRLGDYVAVLSEIVEFPSFHWFDAIAEDRGAVVRIRSIPTDCGIPLKVEAICLPFVFVKSPEDRRSIVDLRRFQLARLSRNYARSTWRALRKQHGEAGRKSSD